MIGTCHNFIPEEWLDRGEALAPYGGGDRRRPCFSGDGDSRAFPDGGGGAFPDGVSDGDNTGVVAAPPAGDREGGEVVLSPRGGTTRSFIPGGVFNAKSGRPGGGFRGAIPATIAKIHNYISIKFRSRCANLVMVFTGDGSGVHRRWWC
ncbi:hypothetical protein L2E82_17090 [Cichorium intybus]|uniref:Uncharacterized protein n=1 Tax=Cichorium intybus TaxID=13427 RepID=A0ACB9F6Z1_CICIN|nr:hypothetical protein L2E82_17090 [Cichorium intybus]